MYRYIANRVLLVIPTLIGAAALVFVYAHSRRYRALLSLG
jgi:ABC-type microcin C transport system permease subunit YejB